MGHRGVTAAGDDPGRGGPQHRPVRQQRPGPARLDQRRRLDTGAEPPDQHRSPGEVGTQQQHVARMRIRGARLVMDVVTVVPDRDQPEPRDGGEHRRPGADDYPHPAAGDGEEAAVPLGRTRGRPTRSRSAAGRRRGRGPPRPWRCPARPGRRGAPHSPRTGRRCCGRRKLIRPGRPGQRIPDRARPAGRPRARQESPGRAGSAATRRAGRCDAAGGSSSAAWSGAAAASGTASRSTLACRGGTARRTTSASVPAYLSATARARRGHLGKQDGLRADRRGQRQQRPLVVGRGQPVEDVAADKPAVEAHPHPARRRRPLSAISAGTR